ncbi:hypothetical protein HDU81_010622, partial [Chytriomyces hyalinus]
NASSPSLVSTLLTPKSANVQSHLAPPCGCSPVVSDPSCPLPSSRLQCLLTKTLSPLEPKSTLKSHGTVKTFCGCLLDAVWRLLWCSLSLPETMCQRLSVRLPSS